MGNSRSRMLPIETALSPEQIKQQDAHRDLLGFSLKEVLIHIAALGVAAIGTVPFYFLAMADIPVTEENPNPPRMSDLSRWTSVIFHALLYRDIGELIVPTAIRFPQAFMKSTFGLPLVSRERSRGVGYWLGYLGQILRSLSYAYVCSLFAIMPTISLGEAASLAETPDGWIKALLVVQMALLLWQVNTFATMVGSFLQGAILQSDRGFRILSRAFPRWFSMAQRSAHAHLREIKALENEIAGLSVHSISDRSLLLKIVLGDQVSTGNSGGIKNLAGLMQAPVMGEMSRNDVLGFGWQVNLASVHPNSGSIINAVRSLVESLPQLQDSTKPQVGRSKCGLFLESLGLCAVFLINALFVIPQIALSVLAMDKMPNAMVRYINPFSVDRDSWSIFFMAGLAMFFFNAQKAFLQGPLAKHLKMLCGDLYEVGLTWKFWRYLAALESQHKLIAFSLVVGVLSVPPFEYIFARGVEGLELMSLSTVASLARDVLNFAKPIHFLLAHFVATLLVASVFHGMGKRIVNWLELWRESEPARNLKTISLRLLGELKGAPSLAREETTNRIEDQTGVKPAWALTWYAGSAITDLVNTLNPDSTDEVAAP